MHEYRYVECLDDGHYSYQCLTCKKYLPAAGNYCMCCGVKFDRQSQCRPRECPAWVWRLWGSDWSDRYYEYRRRLPERPEPGRWLLESRWLYEDMSPGEWGFLSRSSQWRELSAHEFYEQVRDDLTGSVFTDCTIQYRFVRVTKSGRSVSRTFERNPQRIAAES